jgi:hypothetical protein
MTEGDSAVKDDGRVIILEVLGDCNSTFIVVVVEEDDLDICDGNKIVTK